MEQTMTKTLKSLTVNEKKINHHIRNKRKINSQPKKYWFATTNFAIPEK